MFLLSVNNYHIVTDDLTAYTDLKRPVFGAGGRHLSGTREPMVRSMRNTKVCQENMLVK